MAEQTPTTPTFSSFEVPRGVTTNPSVYKPTGEKQSMGNAFIHGIDETKRQAKGAGFAAATTEFARVGTDAALQLINPRWRKNAMRAVADLKQTDPELADKVFSEAFGKQYTAGQNAVRLGASVAEGVVTVIPAGIGFKAAKAGKSAIIASKAMKDLTKIAELGGMTKAMSVIKGNKILRNAATGFYYAAPVGFFSKLKEDADFGDASVEALKFGAAGTLFGGTLAAGAMAARAGAKRGGRILSDAGAYARSQISQNQMKALTKSLDFFRSTATKTKNLLGDKGDDFLNKFGEYRTAYYSRVGGLLDEMYARGLAQLKGFTPVKKAYKDVPFVGGDKVYLKKISDVLRGVGEYADPAKQLEAINADENIKFIRDQFDDIGLASQKAGITQRLLNTKTYFPRYTPTEELDKGIASQISKAVDDVERSRLYRENNEAIAEMIDDAVARGEFASDVEGFKAYYDWADFVTGGGRVLPEANAYIKRMLNKGEVKTIQEAVGKLTDQAKFRKPSLLDKATSLDYERIAELPFYDSNPVRVLLQYADDGFKRLVQAEHFGAKNEEIHKLIGEVQLNLSRGSLAAEDAKQVTKYFSQMFDMAVEGHTKETLAITNLMKLFSVPKLYASSITNLMGTLNNVLISDMKTSFKGISAALQEETIRKAMKSGMLTSELLRTQALMSGKNRRAVDLFFNVTGFQYTEHLNRLISTSTGDLWIKNNYKALAKLLDTPEIDDAAIYEQTRNLSIRSKAARTRLREGLKVQEKMKEEWTKLFPDQEFPVNIGDMTSAGKQLKLIESEFSKAIEVAVKTKASLERKLIKESKDFTDEYVKDLRNDIGSLAEEMKAYLPENTPAVEGPAITKENLDEALAAAIETRRRQMTQVIQRLEDKISKAQDEMFANTDAVTAALPDGSGTPRVKQSKEGLIIELNNEIKNLGESITNMVNELNNKTFILENMIDSFKIADNMVDTKFPLFGKYDEFVGARKADPKVQNALNIVREAETKGLKNDPVRIAIRNLKDLGINVEEAISRGFVSPKDLQNGAFEFVRQTQFLSRPEDLPSLANSPWGSVAFQFKNYTYQQMRMIKNQIAKDWQLRGSTGVIKDLVILGTVFPMSAEVVQDIRSLLTGSERPTDAFDRYMEDLTYSGAGGLLFDAMKQTGSGRIDEFLFGPTYSTATSLIENVVEGNLKEIGKDAIRATGVGQIGINAFKDKNDTKDRETFFQTLGGE